VTPEEWQRLPWAARKQWQARQRDRLERLRGPRGSAALLGWPEFGFGIARSGDDPEHLADVRRWRGDRDEREWPAQLIRGGPFPWSDESVPVARRAAFRAGGVTEAGEWSPSGVLADAARGAS
jgi:hypothetical protein